VELFDKDGYERLLRALRLRADKIDATLQMKKNKSAKREPLETDFSKIKIPPWGKPVFGIFLSLLILWVAIANFEVWMSPVFQALNNFQPFSSSATATPENTSVANNIQITETPSAALTSEPEPASLPTEITDAKGVTMTLVSAGEFTMGYPANDAYRFCQTFQAHLTWNGYPCKKEDYYREEPDHQVYLNNYYVDVYEVSNGEYKKCVDDGTCVQPISNSANRHSKYWNNDFYVDYPVVYVTWEMAKTYCEWRGARLLTEAEWEKAARGVNAFTYPWGKFSPEYSVYDPSFYKNRATLSLNTGEQSTTPVNSNPSGLSPYGIYNMAGNAAEWVSDFYNETYYSQSPSANPPGPSFGDERAVRGGSANSFDVRTTSRDYLWPDEAKPYIGIRCAKDVP
jgi:formylglycine-generating enzyme required for sulfatase activity